MRKITMLFNLIIISALALSACSPASPATETAMEEKPAVDAVMTEVVPTHEVMMEETKAPDAMIETPAWFDVPLTNVNQNQSFTINDLNGKVVLVETLAMWCSNCLKQQTQVQELHKLLGENPDFVSIGLDIDPNENDADLKAYVDKHGFDWVYVVSPKEVSREISDLYGAQFLNPPSTPILIIDRNGSVHPLPFGIKSAADLLEAVNMYLNDSM